MGPAVRDEVYAHPANQLARLTAPNPTAAAGRGTLHPGHLTRVCHGNPGKRHDLPAPRNRMMAILPAPHTGRSLHDCMLK